MRGNKTELLSVCGQIDTGISPRPVFPLPAMKKFIVCRITFPICSQFQKRNLYFLIVLVVCQWKLKNARSHPSSVNRRRPNPLCRTHFNRFELDCSNYQYTCPHPFIDPCGPELVLHNKLCLFAKWNVKLTPELGMPHHG